MKEKQIEEKEDVNKKEIDNNIKEEYLSNSDSLHIKFIQDLAENSYSKLWNDNTFIVFKSYNNIIYVLYSNENQSIIILDLVNNQIINEIKNAHNGSYITHFRHYFDNLNKRDLVISLSKDNNTLKLWNINNCECLLNIKINEVRFLNSACFLNDNNEIFILACSHKFYENKKNFIKIFDLNGYNKKEIKNSD